MKQNIYDNSDFFSSYKELRETENNYNILLEQPAMQKLLPDLNSKTVLDLGCGFGSNCKDFVNLGAKCVTGIDISQKMIAYAKQNNSHSKITYANMPLEDLDKLNEKYDLIYSSLCFHYIKDFCKLVNDIYSLLNENGILLFSQEHPIVTASSDPAGNYLRDKNNMAFAYCINDYQCEGIRSVHWYVDGVIKYHRTLSTVMNTLCDNGFVIQKVAEPVPSDDALQKRSSLAKEFIKPNFLIVKAIKLKNRGKYMFNYKKAAVIGCSGAGKSTFSRKLADITRLPLCYLDMLYWNSDGTHITREEFILRQKRVLADDSWIIDGNFRNTLEYRIKEAELIFFFDLPTDVCINGVLTRGKREDMPCNLPADDELIEYIKNYGISCKPIVYKLFEKYSDKKVITFYSHKDADDYIADLTKEIEQNGYDHKT